MWLVLFRPHDKRSCCGTFVDVDGLYLLIVALLTLIGGLRSFVSSG